MVAGTCSEMWQNNSPAQVSEGFEREGFALSSILESDPDYWREEGSLTFESEFGSTFVTCYCGAPMIEDSYEVPHGDVTGSQKCYSCECCGEIIDRVEGVREDGWPDGKSQPELAEVPLEAYLNPYRRFPCPGCGDPVVLHDSKIHHISKDAGEECFCDRENREMERKG